MRFGSVELTVVDLAVGLAVVALLAVAFVHFRTKGSTGPPPVLASVSLTPGSLNPAVNQETIGSTICVSGWTKTVRPPASYTSPLKVEQMRAYAEAGAPGDFQEDHLISLELGGNPTDPRNLWPEPYPRAAEVDKVENELNAKVCSRVLTLSEAQRRESTLKHEYG
jgi:hypothetical protein